VHEIIDMFLLTVSYKIEGKTLTGGVMDISLLEKVTT